MNGLGAATDSPARRLVAAARTMEPIAGGTGVISADRVFSLLEREFTVEDITREVANSLRPAPDADLSAHKTLLGLSRGPDRKVRLVTTNFDLLFEAASPRLLVWRPAEAARSDAPNGIRWHCPPSWACGQLVPTGSRRRLRSLKRRVRPRLSLGRLATRFIRAVTDNYLVVFLGYTADDPPVQYLLEALYRTGANQNRLFEFQSGYGKRGGGALAARKAFMPSPMIAIPHTVLSGTPLRHGLCERETPPRWSDGVIHRAGRGPEQLPPHERGQLVHLVLEP